LTLYAALIESGRLGEQGLEHFNADGSTVEMIGGEHSPGHETNGGSLGQTVSQAAGVAWARRKKGDNGIVWIFLSDGECQEGQTWEAIMTMSFHKLDNIKIIVDANGQQVDGRTEDVMALRSLEAKFRAFGAKTTTIDGHNLKAMHRAFAQPHPNKPLVVIANTEPYRGIDLLKERYPNLHYVRFKSEEERERYAEALDNM
jgi:transketolase